MKNINRNTLLTGSILLLFFSSCKKSFLEIQPKGSIIVTTVSDYDKLMNTLDIVNTDTDSPIPMGDDAEVSDPFFSGAPLRTQRLFRWDARIYDDNQDPTEVTPLMYQLYIFNKIINGVLDASGGSSTDKIAVQSEARAQRVYNLFILANLYGKPYNQSTSATDPGFPIVTTADVGTTNFKRETVQKMYDFMISELQASIPFIKPSPTSNVRMSKAAAEALLGKIYVFMGKYDLALTQLNLAFKDIPSSLGSKLHDLNETMQPGGIWGYDPVTSQSSYTFSGPLAWTNLENLYARQAVTSWTIDLSDILLAKSTQALFQPGDMRMNFFSPLSYGGGNIPSGNLRVTGPASAGTGITIPDMILLKAECQARTGDLSGSESSLTELRSKRMPASMVPVTYADGNELIRQIITERRREFVLKGYRWFDMRRLSSDPLFAGTTYSHFYYNGNGEKVEYKLTPERMTLRIPAKMLLQNPGMVDNP